LTSGYIRTTFLLLAVSSIVVKTFFRSWDQDRDLGHQVSRPRPRPGENELECTRVSRPRSRNHITGCINSNWWQSTRLKVLQITVIDNIVYYHDLPGAWVSPGSGM